MNVVWTQRALERLAAIKSHIAVDNPSAAQRMGRKIVDRSDLLGLQPGMGHPGRDPGTMEHVVSGTMYILVYEVVGDDVNILSVVHGRDRP